MLSVFSTIAGDPRYSQVSPTSPLASAHPDLANAFYTTLIGSTEFDQERERTGGLIDIQVKPTTDLTIDFNAFYSKLKATNYNRNWMFWGSHVFNGGAGEIPTSYTLTNGTITSAVFPNLGSFGNNHQYAIVDNIYRPGAYAETAYYNLEANYRATDRLSFSARVGAFYKNGRQYLAGVRVKFKSECPIVVDVWRSAARLRHFLCRSR